MTDSSGRRVTDLQAAGLEVLQDGGAAGSVPVIDIRRQFDLRETQSCLGAR